MMRQHWDVSFLDVMSRVKLPPPQVEVTSKELSPANHEVSVEVTRPGAKPGTWKGHGDSSDTASADAIKKMLSDPLIAEHAKGKGE